MRFRLYTYTIILHALLFVSCATQKKMLYVQDIDNRESQLIQYLSPRIQVNDLLSVKISSLYPEAALPYNVQIPVAPNTTEVETLKLHGNLVSQQGYITLPAIGKVMAKGKTVEDLETLISSLLTKGNFLKKPTVNVRVLNSKITILGEVKLPGTYTIVEPNISIFQALGYAKDLTIHGDRRDILVIRIIDEKQHIKHIDLTKTDWFDSEFYFIKQNDVVIVNPNKAKIKSSGMVSGTGTIVSIASIILSGIVLLVK